MHCTLAAMAMAAFLCLGSACSTPSAQGKTREAISQMYQKGEISRSTYLNMVSEYERLHPAENAAVPAAEAAAAQAAPAAATDPVVPEKVKTKNAPILPQGANDDTYTP